MGEGCGREWTREYMIKALKRTWVSKEYKEHRENILYDQERALLPATQEVANARKQFVEMQHRLTQMDEAIRSMKARRDKLSRDMRVVYNRSRNMEATPQEERRAFVKKCPIEDCPGYLSTQWKCGTCNIWACPDCHVSKGEERDAEHTCDPDTLATARLLAQDTKACPNCHIDIYKIDGCNQMWCVKCHTAFDWTTLRITRGIVHNPHYFEYMRETNNGVVPRNPLDNPCGGPVALNARMLGPVQVLMNNEAYKPIYMRLSVVTRSIIHLTQYEIPAMRVDYANRNLELRVKYLNREIIEKDFKIQLQRSEKRCEKKRALYQIYEMVSNTMTDTIIAYIQKCTEVRNRHIERVPSTNVYVTDLDGLVREWETQTTVQMTGIRNYANECLQKIAHTFSSKPYSFNSDFYIRT